MSTVPRPRRADKRRKHNPELLRLKRAARALGLTWAEVVAERDRLRRLELHQRADSDEARRVAWSYHCRRRGWSDSQIPYWRSGFARVYRARLAKGADLTAIPHYDEIAETVRNNCPTFSGWDTEAIWDFLLSEHEPLRSTWEHQRNAVYRLAAGMLGADDELSQAYVPF